MPRHTTLSYIMTLFLTFTLSGLYHGYAAYSLPMQGSTFDRFGRYTIFFLLQPFGIICEDLAIRFYRGFVNKSKKKASSSGWEFIIGYVWVFCWAMLSGNVLLDAYLKTEMGLLGPKPTGEPIFRALWDNGHTTSKNNI